MKLTTSGNSLELRAAQILAYTDEDAMDESNPITHAEIGPNRFHTMSLFFSDSDGVQIQEDADLNEITIKYFKDNEEDIELTEGPVYDWALKHYETSW